MTNGFQGGERLHALDAVRAGALLLGVTFHACLPFLTGPQLWMVRDAQSVELTVFFYTSHLFRMTLFFCIAGFFARMLLERRGVLGFVRDRGKRIALTLALFWPVLFAAVLACFLWGVAVSNGGSLPATGEPPPPMTVENFPLLHLWFLYLLLMFYAGALLLRGAAWCVDRNGALGRALDAIVRVAVKTRLAPLALAAPLFAMTATDAGWLAWFGVPTPDKGLVPDSIALVAYGVAFGFGWLLQRQSDAMEAWAKNWAAHLATALALTGVCLWIVGTVPVLTPMPQGPMKLVYAACFALATWEWTFAAIGAALRFLSKRNDAIRYVADASYWIYLVHMPIVMALQVIAVQLDWPWEAKLAFILVSSFSATLASYHLLVRYTWLGAILNGRKHVRVKAQPKPQPVAAE